MTGLGFVRENVLCYTGPQPYNTWKLFLSYGRICKLYLHGIWPFRISWTWSLLTGCLKVENSFSSFVQANWNKLDSATSRWPYPLKSNGNAWLKLSFSCYVYIYVWDWVSCESQLGYTCKLCMRFVRIFNYTCTGSFDWPTRIRHKHSLEFRAGEFE